MRLTNRQRLKLFKVNKTMDELHNLNNAIYESWMEEEYHRMEELLKKQIIELKKILNGIQEET